MMGSGFGDEVSIQFDFQIENGGHKDRGFSHVFKIVSADEEQQTKGQSIYAQLRNATGVLEPENTIDFLDKCVQAIVGKMGRVGYAALSQI
jgi:hypothetical protein